MHQNQSIASIFNAQKSKNFKPLDRVAHTFWATFQGFKTWRAAQKVWATLRAQELQRIACTHNAQKSKDCKPLYAQKSKDAFKP